MASAVREAFGKASLYEILNIQKTATAAEIKKAYFKLALRYVSRKTCALLKQMLINPVLSVSQHPDKNDSPESKIKFQALSFIHTLLSDGARRREYDASVR